MDFAILIDETVYPTQQTLPQWTNSASHPSVS